MIAALRTEGGASLDRAAIEARIPHRGRMCLLDRLIAWDEASLACTATSHRDVANPLRTAGGLLAPCGIEYAAQAMALHGALRAPGGAATPGYLASVRNVVLAVPRLDDVPGELQVRVRWLAGDADELLYAFVLSDEAGRLLVEGRAMVVLNTALPGDAATGHPPAAAGGRGA